MPTTPRNSVEKTLADIWSRVLERESIAVEDDFFQLGGDSIAAAQLVVEIERAFGLNLPVTTLLQGPTVEALARIINRQTGPPVQSVLVPLQPQGAGPPFFCVHGAGGEVLSLAGLARHFAPDQPFYAIRGAFAGKGQSIRVEEMAAHYIEEIHAQQPQGPYFLGGYSFGGSVAFEMAQQLVARGRAVAFLALLDHTCPTARYRQSRWRPAFVWEFIGNLPCWVVDDLLRSPRKVLEQLWRRMAAMKKGWGRPAATELETLFDLPRIPDKFRVKLVLHYQAMREYVPVAYPGRVTLFRARTRPLFNLYGRDLGWGKLARSGLDTVMLPGNHDTILKEPHVRVFAERLCACLRKAREMA